MNFVLLDKSIEYPLHSTFESQIAHPAAEDLSLPLRGKSGAWLLVEPRHETIKPLPSRQSLRGLDWFTFFVADVQTGFGPFISVYLAAHQWTQTEIGIVLTIGALAALLGQVPGGALVDAIRSKRLLAAASVIGVGVSALIIAIRPSFMAVAFAQALHGAAGCVLNPAIAAITLGLVGYGAMAKRFGRNARFASIGNGLAAALMGACGLYFSTQTVFLVTAALTFPTLAALFQIRKGEIDAARARGNSESSPPKAAGAAGELLGKPALWIFIGCVALFQIANTPMLPLLGASVAVHSPGWASALIGACIVLPQLLAALFAPWAGKFAQDWGRRPVLLAGFAALFIRGLLFAHYTDPLVVLAAQSLDGVSAAALGVLFPIVIADIARGTGRYNLALGVAGLSIGVGAAISTSVAGYLTDAFGEHAVFLGLAATASIGLLLLASFMPETMSPKRSR